MSTAGAPPMLVPPNAPKVLPRVELPKPPPNPPKLPNPEVAGLGAVLVLAAAPNPPVPLVPKPPNMFDDVLVAAAGAGAAGAPNPENPPPAVPAPAAVAEGAAPNPELPNPPVPPNPKLVDGAAAAGAPKLKLDGAAPAPPVALGAAPKPNDIEEFTRKLYKSTNKIGGWVRVQTVQQAG